jgi:hypothetical protein
MEVSGQHHPALPQGRTMVSTEQEPVRMIWRREKSLVPARIQTQDFPSPGLITIPTTVPQLPEYYTTLATELVIHDNDHISWPSILRTNVNNEQVQKVTLEQ